MLRFRICGRELDRRWSSTERQMVWRAGFVERCAENCVKMSDKMSSSSTACCVGIAFYRRLRQDFTSRRRAAVEMGTHALQLLASSLYHLVDDLVHDRIRISQFDEHVLERWMQTNHPNGQSSMLYDLLMLYPNSTHPTSRYPSALRCQYWSFGVTNLRPRRYFQVSQTVATR